MLTALLYLVVMAAVAAVVYLFATLVFGRGEEMAPLAPGATPTTLPTAGVTGDDVRRLRFQQTVRGYKMAEVDWALGRLAAEVDGLRARVAELEGVPYGSAAGVGHDGRSDSGHGYRPSAFDEPSAFDQPAAFEEPSAFDDSEPATLDRAAHAPGREHTGASAHASTDPAARQPEDQR